MGLKGKDYIFYRHPNLQKTPKSEHLREWYNKLLLKAKSQGIIYSINNLYDNYFSVLTDSIKSNTSVLKIPYYDGDYWPGEAENILELIELEYETNKCSFGENTNALTTFDFLTKKDNKINSTDLNLMIKLGKVIIEIKDNFIIAHLYPFCNFCLEYFGTTSSDLNIAWFLRVRRSNNLKEHQYYPFSLCQKCYRYVMQISKKDKTYLKTKHWKLFDIEMLDLSPRFFLL